jgi:thioredoxin 1
MKKIILLPALFISFILLSSGISPNKVAAEKQPGIVFHEGTWASALAQALKENKLVFLDAHAVWCRPCKLMKIKTFKDPAVAKFYNNNFINVEMDMERGEGKALANKLGIRAYPTLFFINGKGEVIAKKVGFLNAPDFLELGKTVVKGL